MSVAVVYKVCRVPAMKDCNALLLFQRYGSNCAGNFARHKRGTASRAFMVEENAVASKDVVRLKMTIRDLVLSNRKKEKRSHTSR